MSDARSPHANELSALLNGFNRIAGVPNTSRRKQRDFVVQMGSEDGCKRDIPAVNRRCFSDVPARHMDKIKRHGVAQSECFQRVFNRESASRELRRQANAHQERRAGSPSDLIHNRSEEPSSIGLVSAPSVLSPIGSSSQKLCNEVAVSAVEFNAVKPGLFAPLSSSSEGPDDIVYFFYRVRFAVA